MRKPRRTLFHFRFSNYFVFSLSAFEVPSRQRILRVIEVVRIGALPNARNEAHATAGAGGKIAGEAPADVCNCSIIARWRAASGAHGRVAPGRAAVIRKFDGRSPGSGN